MMLIEVYPMFMFYVLNYLEEFNLTGSVILSVVTSLAASV
jgi:hypothetical protein